MRRRGAASLRRAAAGVLLLPALTGPAPAQDAAELYETCFERIYGAEHLAAHPNQRVVSMAVHFQTFEDDLLASVIYRLRFGTEFGFSGACYEKIEGGFLCEACANDHCEASGEQFKIMWSGGDSVKLVNDLTGMLAKNGSGGRDYLATGDEHAEFLLYRGSTEDCAW